ncbi:MAG: hypothetical protein SGCHY_001298 [Lobulomycetales sp.]
MSSQRLSRELLRLGLIALVHILFGILSFCYTEAPTWILLTASSKSVLQTIVFSAVLSVSWSLKPLYQILLLQSSPRRLYIILVVALVISGGSLALSTFLPFIYRSGQWMLASFFAAASSLLVDHGEDSRFSPAFLNSLSWICLCIGATTSKSLVAFSASFDGRGASGIIGSASLVAMGVIVIPLLLYWPLVSSRTTPKASAELSSAIVMRDIARFISHRHVLAVLVFIFGSVVVTPDVSRALAIFKMKKLGIGADMQAVIELLSDLVSLVSTVVFSRFIFRTPQRWIFLFCIVYLSFTY